MKKTSSLFVTLLNCYQQHLRERPRGMMIRLLYACEWYIMNIHTVKS